MAGKDRLDLFLNDKLYKGGFMSKTELADSYKISLVCLKSWLKKGIEKNPSLFPSFTSERKTVSPIEINRIIELVGEW